MAINIQSQERMNATPPMGVIMPNAVCPVIASRYKLPENRMIPENINQPHHFSGRNDE